jgi:hypothetical protein
MADDYDDYSGDDFDTDDLDDDDGEFETGVAAVLCLRATSVVMHTALEFHDSVAAAVAAASDPCGVDGCLGVHSIATRGERGEVHVAPMGTVGLDDLRVLMRDAAREHRKHENQRHRAIYWATQKRLGLAKPEEDER